MQFSDLKTKPKILLGMSMPVAMIVVVGSLAIAGMGRIFDTNGWVNHTYKVLGQAESIVGHAVDMETGMRGFMLAGKDQFLEPYNGGQQAVFAAIKNLQDTVSDNPGQVARLGEVEKTLKEWQANITEPMMVTCPNPPRK